MTLFKIGLFISTCSFLFGVHSQAGVLGLWSGKGMSKHSMTVKNEKTKKSELITEVNSCNPIEVNFSIEEKSLWVRALNYECIGNHMVLQSFFMDIQGEELQSFGSKVGSITDNVIEFETAGSTPEYFDHFRFEKQADGSVKFTNTVNYHASPLKEAWIVTGKLQKQAFKDPK